MREINLQRLGLKKLVGAAAIASTLIPNSALACGGFFCDAVNPVNQAAERIIFAQDGDDVTQIVEVLYEGDAEKFSWVLPVPGTPTPGVSSVQAFDRLQMSTNPTYQLQSRFPESCDVDFTSADGGDGDAAGDPNSDGPEVVVLDSGAVGPFNYETISVNAEDSDPADVAVDWLSENGYEVAPSTRDVLGPYLANGLNLIAFRLQKGKSAGAIRPITLEYTANSMAIPIRPTAVAASEDMPILVWVLGDHRAVSTNYRGLEINELLIDWFNPSASYNNVVIAAANEAGGQGFVTEMAASTEGFSEIVAPAWEQDTLVNYSDETDVEVVLSEIVSRFANHDGFREVVEEHVSLRSSVTLDEFLSCTWCYFRPGNFPDFGLGGASSGDPNEPIPDTDPVFDTNLSEFLAAVEEDVLQPIADTAALFDDLDYMTRLYTTMSAEEMTLDPIFEFNPDLDDVDRNHTADWERSCDDDSWTVTLSDGEKVYGSGREWPHALNDTDLPANVRILQFSTSGAPEVITDNRAEIQTIHSGTEAGKDPVPFKKKSGLCSWEEGPAPSAPWAWLIPAALGGAWLSRRRRVRS